MKVVIPNKLTVTSSTITENDADDGPVWSASTTYARDAKVRHNHKRYISLADANMGNIPEETRSGITAKWRDMGPTNLWACIDDFVNTQTIAPEGQTTLKLQVPFSRATSFALINVYASDVSVVIKDDMGDVFFERSYRMVEDLTSFSVYQYCFYPLSASTLVVEPDVPMPIIGTLDITLSATESPAIGHIVAGRAYYIGQSLYEASTGELDYSRKKTSEFGITELSRGQYANTMSLSLYVPPDRMDAVNRLMKDMRALPCLWIGDNEDSFFESLTVFGWKQDFRTVLAGPNEVQMSLEISGLI